MRILIVDDDDDALKMLERALSQSGYEVETARSGDEALALLRSGSSRLVISDWEMPGMSGEDLCRAVRAGDFSSYVYFILLTSHGGSAYTVRGLSAGADDFISKPFDPAELSVRVRAGERVLALETRDLTLFAMAKLAESRDPETGSHLERIQGYARVLAEQLLKLAHPGVDAEYVRLLHLTSPLHDIGKVGIPDAVLLKPGRLSDREFEVMKTHTVLGAETLGAALAKFPSAAFLRMARDIALSHHERYDGAGYPRGLAREQIPLCGRIVAVADVYDALISRRVYKEPFAHDVAREIMFAKSGTHFDPVLTEAFRQAEEQFIEIRKRFGDGVGAELVRAGIRGFSLR